MLSSRKLRNCGLAVALGLCATAVAGCGFRPLYGPQSAAATQSEMGRVKIDLIEDRIGQQLHNALLDRVTPHGQPQAPDFVLSIEIEETLQELGLRRDETATRANLNVSAAFVLRSNKALDGKKILLSGQSRSVNSYNIVDSDFATLVAERDARNRAVAIIADDISTRLAIFFSSRSGS